MRGLRVRSVAGIAMMVIAIAWLALPVPPTSAAASASMVKDINPTGGSYPYQLTKAGGLVFFQGCDDLNNTAGTINQTAKGINGSAATILGTARSINDGVAQINTNLNTTIVLAKLINNDTSSILGEANEVDHYASCIDRGLLSTDPGRPAGSPC